MHYVRRDMNINNAAICRCGFFHYLLLAAWLTAGAVSAQNDEDPVLKYGPDPEIHKPESIEFALRSWQWQSKLIQTAGKDDSGSR